MVIRDVAYDSPAEAKATPGTILWHDRGTPQASPNPDGEYNQVFVLPDGTYLTAQDDGSLGSWPSIGMNQQFYVGSSAVRARSKPGADIVIHVYGAL